MTRTFTGNVTGDVTGDVTGNVYCNKNSKYYIDIVQLTATQTLTNKTLTSPIITGTGAAIGTFLM